MPGLDQPTFLFVRGDENQPDKSAVIAAVMPAPLAFADLEIQSVPLPLQAWQPERQPWVFEAHLNAARRKVGSAERNVRRQIGVVDRNDLHNRVIAIKKALKSPSSLGN